MRKYITRIARNSIISIFFLLLVQIFEIDNLQLVQIDVANCVQISNPILKGGRFKDEYFLDTIKLNLAQLSAENF